jgi:CRISPR-associated protein Csc3
MATFLQTLLLRTLPADLDPVLHAYIETVLPAMEWKFGTIPTFSRSEADWFLYAGELNAVQQAIYRSNDANQSLLVFILNSLLTAWNLLPFLSTKLSLSDDEKRLLCLGSTFQGYNTCYLEKTAPFTSTAALALGETLNLDKFWVEWHKHLPELACITSTIGQMAGNNADLTKQNSCKLAARRLLSLRKLLSFGTIAAQLSSAADIVTEPEGNRLQALLRELEIDRTLIYSGLQFHEGQ